MTTIHCCKQQSLGVVCFPGRDKSNAAQEAAIHTGWVFFSPCSRRYQFIPERAEYILQTGAFKHLPTTGLAPAVIPVAHWTKVDRILELQATPAFTAAPGSWGQTVRAQAPGRRNPKWQPSACPWEEHQRLIQMCFLFSLRVLGELHPVWCKLIDCKLVMFCPPLIIWTSEPLYPWPSCQAIILNHFYIYTLQYIV